MLLLLFTCLDFDDESVEVYKKLLLRCYIEPLYLKTTLFMFELDKQLV